MKFCHKFFVIYFFIIINSTLFAKDVLIDRLLVSINNNYYTQRQMECYLLIKGVLFGNKDDDFLVTENNWKKNFDQFVLDINKIEKFKNITNKTVLEKQSTHEHYSEIFFEKTENIKEVSKAVRRLVLDNNMLDEFLSLVIVVESWAKFFINEDEYFDINSINVIITYAKEYKSINPIFAK